MRLLGALAAFTFATLNLTAAQAAPRVEVTGVITGGNGCPQGTAQVVMAPDGSAFTVLYDAMNLHVDPSNPNGILDCQVHINIKKPLMMGFFVESADFRGFVALDPGMVAEQQVSLASGATSDIRRMTSDFGVQRWAGPVADNYTITTVRPRTGLDILNCVPPREKTRIVVTSRISIRPGTAAGNGQVAVDSTDGRLAQHYRLRWQNCANDIGNAIGGIIDLIGGGRRPR